MKKLIENLGFLGIEVSTDKVDGRGVDGTVISYHIVTLTTNPYDDVYIELSPEIELIPQKYLGIDESESKALLRAICELPKWTRKYLT